LEADWNWYVNIEWKSIHCQLHLAGVNSRELPAKTDELMLSQLCTPIGAHEMPN
jgi:hypothetical protein